MNFISDLNFLGALRHISDDVLFTIQVKDPNQPNKDEIYEKHYEVLEEEVKKMRDLMLFQQKTIQTLCGILTNFITGGKRASDQLLWKIGEVLDLLLILDEIKNAKACLSNDLSFYKRYVFGLYCAACLTLLQRSRLQEEQTKQIWSTSTKQW